MVENNGPLQLIGTNSYSESRYKTITSPILRREKNVSIRFVLICHCNPSIRMPDRKFACVVLKIGAVRSEMNGRSRDFG
jgi:hypothetical protein